jgi:hypothetical protein
MGGISMKLLQLPNPGNGGRLGNQLFTIASTIGIALNNGYTPRFPANWKYREFFNIPDEWFGEMTDLAYILSEYKFEYDERLIRLIERKEGCSITIVNSYLQSPKYWAGHEAEIRKYLTPKGCNPASIDKIALHHRRGDYIGNPNYVNLPMSYYMNYMKDFTAFSDDHAFLRLHYPNDHFHVSEIEDFKHMVEHDQHLCSNSTFSWWAAYLSGGWDIHRPSHYFAGDLAKRCSTKDFWPSLWFTAPDTKFNIHATFIIPVQYDHPDRLENCTAVCAFLNEHFNCEILIGEINGSYFGNIPNTKHIPFTMSHFHRTKVINELSNRATYDIVFNWDADVFCSPIGILNAYKELKEGADICYPYDGTFYWCDRQELANAKGDLGGWAGKSFKAVGASPTDRTSYGGAVAYNRDAFFKAGGENENLISYGHDDQERWKRFKMLNLNVKRVAGALYHINHARGVNSSFSHEYGHKNMKYWQWFNTLNATQLQEHIKTWSWAT